MKPGPLGPLHNGLVTTPPTNADTSAPRLIHLQQAGVSVVVDLSGPGLPVILYWGAGLGELDDGQLAAVRTVLKPPINHNPHDQPWDVAILPSFESGWLGRPGVEGSRAGRDWSPSFQACDFELVCGAHAGDGRVADQLRAHAVDPHARLGLDVEVELLVTGLLRARATVTNQADDDYMVAALRTVLPVPARGAELLDFTGRHTSERIPQRTPFTVGIHSREQRSGRTGLDAASLIIAGLPGFGYQSREVWAVHVAFSGNQTLYAEQVYNGARVIGGGELLQHGEIVLGRGDTYQSPWLYGSYADGLDAMAARFHQHVRTGPAYPARPRPVIANTWEAVYFDQDLDTLGEIAERAAAVGAERFVLDDGWFGGRRDDRRGLGDWYVSPDVWPQGLDPLIRRVHGAGMDFGLWVEPEMISLDSDLARAHPDWIFKAGDRVGYSSRHQHVLDLTHPEAYAHILAALDTLLNTYPIAYLKWDHNRLLVEAGHQPSGRPAIHAQTLAVYQMMDELRTRHPGLEIESCASGAGRVDLGILEHAQRVWGSDTHDPIERRQIHRGLELILPPELIGAHIGPSPSRTTGRTHSLGFRAETAIWCHLGLEMDVRDLGEEETADLAGWIEFHKRHRDLLHTGTVVNADHPDPAIWISGVVAPDRSRALFGVAALRRSATWPPGPVQLPGLDPDRRYRIEVAERSLPDRARASQLPEWVLDAQVVSGQVLQRAGVQLIALQPESSYLISVTAASEGGGAVRGS